MMRFNDFYAKQDAPALLDDFYALWREAKNSGVDAESLHEKAKGVLQRIVVMDLFLLAACEWIGNWQRGLPVNLMHWKPCHT